MPLRVTPVAVLPLTIPLSSGITLGSPLLAEQSPTTAVSPNPQRGPPTALHLPVFQPRLVTDYYSQAPHKGILVNNLVYVRCDQIW